MYTLTTSINPLHSMVRYAQSLIPNCCAKYVANPASTEMSSADFDRAVCSVPSARYRRLSTVNYGSRQHEVGELTAHQDVAGSRRNLHGRRGNLVLIGSCLCNGNNTASCDIDLTQRFLTNHGSDSRVSHTELYICSNRERLCCRAILRACYVMELPTKDSVSRTSYVVVVLTIRYV